MNYYLGIDVGTGSARVALFSALGEMIMSKKENISLWSYEEVYKEQSSEDIWGKIIKLIKEVVTESKVDKTLIKGIGFDATCSLVAIGDEGNPVTLSKSGNENQNVILWMDHRAKKQADKINSLETEALKYVGGKVSLEMEIPKILWVKENLPESYQKTRYFFDLPDFLVYKACNKVVRSVCSLGCKWTYLAHEKKWDVNLLESIGLTELIENKSDKIGGDIEPIGNLAGKLTKLQADEMGLVEGINVGVSMIDAHAGGIGVLGINLKDKKDFSKRIALISGTSNCHMAVSKEANFIDGIWGPYYDAMLPGMWLSEGGQSTAGALVDYVIKNHGAYNLLLEDSKNKNLSIYENLNNMLIISSKNQVDYLTEDIHTLPYFLGNRSPIGNPDLRGMVSGISMDMTIENLSLHYYSALQSVAYGTRHIIEEMNANGYDIEEIIATGGGVKNSLLLESYANITGCQITIPAEEESVLLGAATLGAVAAGEYSDIFEGMNEMSHIGKVLLPKVNTKEYHDKKYKVFKEMYLDYIKYKKMMS